MSTAATMRVLNVLKHWISKHPQVPLNKYFKKLLQVLIYTNEIYIYNFQDFENETRLKAMTIDFLEDILFSPNLLPAEHKIAGQLLRLLTMDETKKTNVDLNLLLIPSQVHCYKILQRQFLHKIVFIKLQSYNAFNIN